MSPVVYTLKHVDGRVFSGLLGSDIIKTLDRRSDQAPVVVVFEATTKGGLVVRLWPEDVESLDAEMRA